MVKKKYQMMFRRNRLMKIVVCPRLIQPKTSLFRQLFLLFLFLSLSACAMGEPRMIRHNLSFDTIRDSADGKHPEAEVINYQYGNSGQYGTYANKEMVELGQTFRGGITGIVIPRPEFLYVKWRILATGEV